MRTTITSPYAVRFLNRQMTAMRIIRREIGIPLARQIRDALDDYLSKFNELPSEYKPTKLKQKENKSNEVECKC